MTRAQHWHVINEINEIERQEQAAILSAEGLLDVDGFACWHQLKSGKQQRCCLCGRERAYRNTLGWLVEPSQDSVHGRFAGDAWKFGWFETRRRLPPREASGKFVGRRT